MAKILTVSRKSHHPIETLFITEYDFVFNSMLLLINKYSDQYQYLGRRRYETEPFKFTTKRLI